jgi:hypothetical protein
MTTNNNEKNERKEDKGTSLNRDAHATQRVLASDGKSRGRKFISEIKMQLNIAERAYKDFKEENGFHDAMGFKWNDRSALQRGREMRKRISELKKQILQA